MSTIWYHRTRQMLAVALVLMLVMATGMGCNRMTKKQKGAAVGAGAGTVVGGAVGKAAGNTALGAVIGAAVGGTAGAYVGDYMDRQAEDIEQEVPDVEVERVTETVIDEETGAEEEIVKGIVLTFDTGVLFDYDKAELRPQSRDNLRKLADILQEYPDTDILIEGHTDAEGSEEYNMELSRQRAVAVETYLRSLGVRQGRMTVRWYGETQPVATNATPEGRQLNRRVDLTIMANEDLVRRAQTETQR